MPYEFVRRIGDEKLFCGEKQMIALRTFGQSLLRAYIF